MELATTLKSQTIQNKVREVGINENYWYPILWSNQLQDGQVVPATIWQRSIAVYRDNQGKVYAIENACPHKGVELHLGKVEQDRIVCPYHGWEFDGSGQCVNIPYLPKEQKLPCANARTYPVQEKYGIIWIFPGDAELSTLRQLPEVPEYNDPTCLVIPVTGKFKAHFSICNENTMDVFHGYLHKDLQGWFDPVLTRLEGNDSYVSADYKVSYQGWLIRFLGIGINEKSVTTRTVSIHYRYPHYHNSLEGVSSLYVMRLPVSPNETRSFSLLFLPKISIPKLLIPLMQPIVMPLVRRFLFMRFLEQDIGMMESEQRNYRANPDRRYVEVNPAILALQRVIVRQYEQFVQQSNQLQSHPQRNFENVAPAAEALASATETV